MTDFLKSTSTGVLILIRLQPRSSKNEIAGVHGGRLKVRLTAPPVDSKANEALCRFISEKLKVSKGSARLLSGEKSRQKTVLVEGISMEKAAEFLLKKV